jgi:hypothetical protein
MFLNDLIEELEKLPQDKVVKNGFGYPQSYHEDYKAIVFESLPEAKISDMLAHAKGVNGSLFEGRKGKTYKLDLWVVCYMAADIADYPIHPLQIRNWTNQ